MSFQIDPTFAERLFPLADEERATLEASILDEGCRDPLVTWRGLLLDGHNRYEICTAHGIQFETVEVDLPDREAALAWIDLNQISRRNITKEARDLILGRSYNRAKVARGGDRRSEKASKGQSGTLVSTAERIAAEYGVSARTVKRAGAFAAKVSADPKLLDAVRAGEPVKLVERRWRNQEAEAKRVKAAAEAAASAGRELLADLRVGDFREVLADVPDGSVDAVICDPPYPKGYLPLLADLAVLADRVLKPDGVLAVLFGQTYLPEVYRLLEGGRPYRWTICYMTPGASYQAHARACTSQWKPVLVYGAPKGPRFHDVVISNRDDKDHHHWGQNADAFRDLVEKLTPPSGLVLDPFLGGGGTAVAAFEAGRDFIGCDIEAECVETARGRLRAEVRAVPETAS